MGAGSSTLFRVEVLCPEGFLGMVTTDGPTLAIGNVDPDGPMAAAGVAKGDRVMSVDGKPIHDLERKAAAMAMKEALESSACQRLTLVIARKCRPDRIPLGAVLLNKDGSEANADAVDSVPALGGNSLRLPDDEASDTGGQRSDSASPTVYEAERESYPWEEDAIHDYDRLMQRKEVLREINLEENDDARAEWIALISALNRLVPERARARSRDAHDAAERQRRTDEEARAAEASRHSTSKPKGRRFFASSKSPPPTSPSSPQPYPTGMYGVDGGGGGAAMIPSPVLRALPDRLPPPTTAKEAFDRLMANESTVAWLKGLYTNQADCDAQQAVWTFLKMESRVPTTMAAEVLTMIERLPFVSGMSDDAPQPAASSGGADLKSHAVIAVPAEQPTDTTTDTTAGPADADGNVDGASITDTNGAAEAADGKEAAAEHAPSVPPETTAVTLSEDDAEVDDAKGEPPTLDTPAAETVQDDTTPTASQDAATGGGDLSTSGSPCPPGCTCLLCKVNEAADEGAVPQDMPLCSCGNSMILSDYKKESYKTGWFCDDCPTRGKRKGMRWFCFKCRHDLCKKCGVNHLPAKLAKDAKRRELTAALVGGSDASVSLDAAGAGGGGHEAAGGLNGDGGGNTLETFVGSNLDFVTPRTVVVGGLETEKNQQDYDTAKSDLNLSQATALLDRAAALSPDSASAADAEATDGQPTRTSLKAARLRHSASQLLEQLNKAMEEA
eukprot:m.73744 g.73744  ORF g.73744 m.73744 type:complete len:729 (+) comp8861_c0_seq2:2-2188(+)